MGQLKSDRVCYGLRRPESKRVTPRIVEGEETLGDIIPLLLLLPEWWLRGSWLAWTNARMKSTLISLSDHRCTGARVRLVPFSRHKTTARALHFHTNKLSFAPLKGRYTKVKLTRVYRLYWMKWAVKRIEVNENYEKPLWYEFVRVFFRYSLWLSFSFFVILYSLSRFFENWKWRKGKRIWIREERKKKYIIICIISEKKVTTIWDYGVHHWEVASLSDR